MKIQGKILDEQDNPVSGASVDILVGETRLARVTSSNDGNFEFSSSGAVPGDTVTLAVAKEGYRSTQATKAVDADDLDQWRVNVKESRSSPPPPPPPQRKWPLIAVGLALVGLIVWFFWPHAGDGPRVVSFAASPDTIQSGATSALAWSVEEAETVAISPDIGPVRPAGRSSVTPSQTTIYTLVAKNAAGESTAQVTIQVEAQPSKSRVVSFTANPDAIQNGARSTLAWRVDGAESVAISPDVGPVRPSGRSTVTPSQTTIYTLVAKNAAGESTAQVTVQVEAQPSKPRVISFTANPDAIQKGARSTLAWRVGGAETVTISPTIGSVQPSGQNSVTPSETTTYTLVAKNAAGETRARVAIRVDRRESYQIASLRPASPARLSVRSDSVTVMLRYSLQQAGTLNVIPLDATKRRVANIGWQARNATVWSGKVGTSIDMPVRNGSGTIELQLKAMSPAQVRFLRLRVVRGSDVALLQDVAVDYRFSP